MVGSSRPQATAITARRDDMRASGRPRNLREFGRQGAERGYKEMELEGY